MYLLGSDDLAVSREQRDIICKLLRSFVRRESERFSARIVCDRDNAISDAVEKIWGSQTAKSLITVGIFNSSSECRMTDPVCKIVSCYGGKD